MYEAHFGLTASPFRLSPDPSFFFGSKGHKRALAYLRYGLTQKEGFIVVTGSPGTGKTTLARALLEELAKNKVIVSELNTTHLEADDVLRMVAASFGLEHENLTKASLLKRLERFFLTKYRAGYHCLLMVDESQNLPFGSLEELRMLSNFYAGKHALLQIFLLGQQQFRDALYDPKLEQLRQRVVAATHLDPLNAKETRAYILHRLNHVGWKQNPQFTQRAFAYIYTLTTGIPRRINTFCDRLMLFASLEEVTEINDAHVKAVAKELMYEVTSNKSGITTEAASNPSQTSFELATMEEATPSEIINIEEEFRQEEELQASEISQTEIVQNAPLLVPEEEKLEKLTAQKQTVFEDQSPSSSNDILSAKNESNDTAADDSSSKVTTNNNKKQKRKHQNKQYTSVKKTPYSKSRNSTQTSPRKNVEHKPQYLNQQPGLGLVALAVEYYHQPDEHKELLRSSSVLPPGIAELFRVAMGKLHIDLDAFEGLSDMSQADLKEAARCFIKEILLSNSSDYYRRLGLTKTASQEQIKAHYQILFKLFQPDQEKDAGQWNESFAIKINQAYVSLREKNKRDAYDYFLDSLEIVEIDQEIEVAPGSVDVPDISDKPSLKLEAGNAHKTFLAVVKNNRNMIIASVIFMIIGLASVVFAPSLFDLQAPNQFVDRQRDGFLTNAPTENIPLSPIDEHDINRIDTVLNSDSEFGEPTLFNDSTDLNSPITNIVNQNIDSTSLNKSTREKNSEPKIRNDIVSQKTTTLATEKPGSLKTNEPVKKLETVKQNIVKDIPRKELDAVMSLFYQSYKEGDLKEFIRLFYKSAITNDRKNRVGIAKDYSRLFSSTDKRSISIENLEWNIVGNKAIGIGDFIVRIVKTGDTETKSFEGTIRLVALKGRGKTRFKEMYHAYSED